MPIIGVPSFAETRSNLIEDALAILGVIGSDQSYSSWESANPNLLARIERRLNAMLKAWTADGVHLWKLTEYVIPFVAGQNAYPIEPRVLRVYNIRRRSSAGTEVFMGYEGAAISRNEYMALPNKDSAGTPVQAFYDRQRTGGTLYVWPTPATGTTDSLVLTGEVVVDDLSADGDYPDFPQEWMAPIAFCLARDIQTVVQMRMEPEAMALAAQYYESLKDFDRDMGSTYFAPAVL